MKKRYIFLTLLLIIICGIAYLSTYKLEVLYITGCNAISQEDIKLAVGERNVMDNTVLTYWKLKFTPIEDIPFLAKIDYEIGEKNQLNVIVYEKSMAGCAEYMNYYIYFDKDGVVLESSDRLLDGIPCITGLNFEEWELGEKLPIDDDKKFNLILTITQLVDKYGLDIQGITFTAENEIILMHDRITIELGEGEHLAIQLMNLGSILENLEGLEGTLYMKDFDSDSAEASFSKK